MYSTNNVTLGSFVKPYLQWKSNKYDDILSMYCSNRYIMLAMRMLHIVICGLSLSTIFFPHYLINGMIFEKTSLNIKCVF
jgi:hypothetical protein